MDGEVAAVYKGTMLMGKFLPPNVHRPGRWQLLLLGGYSAVMTI